MMSSQQTPAIQSVWQAEREKNKAMRIRILVLLAVAATSAAEMACAQSTLNSDRPGFSESPITVDIGVWQLETGVEYLRDRDGGDFTQLTLPDARLRFGLADDFELVINWDGVRKFSSGGSSTTGLTDAQIGLKIQVTDDRASTVASLFGGISIPLGDDQFSSDSTDPFIGVAWGHTGRMDWFGTALIIKQDSDYTLGNGVGINFAKAARSNAFVEWQAILPESGSARHSLNGGYIWSHTRRSQFDINASLGLNDSAPDYGLGAGWVYRF
jgi:hypothetical protein